MALINCPECGRENVSDTAEVCPNCGYGIKAHFDEIKRLQKEKEQKKEIEIEYKKYTESRINNIPLLTKPKYQGELYFFWILSAMMLFGIVGAIESYIEEESSLGTLMFICAILIFAGICSFIIGFSFYKEAKSDYKLCKENPREYQKLVVARQDQRLKEQSHSRSSSMSVKCPYCNSYNTTKISTTSKAVNTAMFGILGQKRKYQWHCNNCKSNF